MSGFQRDIVAASEQQAEPRATPGDTPQPLRRYWAPRYWPAWLFIGWLKLTALLPWRLTVGLHKGLGHLLWYLLPRARRVVLRNLEICFPELGPAETKALARRYFANLGASIGEIGLAWFGDAPWARPPMRAEGLEHLRAALARGKGAILFSGHFTTLELANKPLKTAIPLFAFMYRSRNNPLIDEMQTRGRRRTAHVAVANTSTRAMLRLLRQNAAVLRRACHDHHGHLAPGTCKRRRGAATALSPSRGRCGVPAPNRAAAR
jgi:KDO2-lipid IV(A) lauroyltransferase